MHDIFFNLLHWEPRNALFIFGVNPEPLRLKLIFLCVRSFLLSSSELLGNKYHFEFVTVQLISYHDLVAVSLQGLAGFRKE